MSTEQFANNATNTLNGAITNVAATLIVHSATGFPTSGNFRILIDSEYMLVTAVSGTTFTVTRGVESSSAVTHGDGATVTHLVTAAVLTNFEAIRGNAGTAANRPAAAGTGATYVCTDVPASYVDDPATSAWQQIIADVATPGLSVGTFTTTGNIVLTQYADAIWATLSNSTIGIGSCALTADAGLGASSVWSVELEAQFDPPFNTQYPEVGVCVANGVTGGTSNAWVMAAWQNLQNLGFHQEQIGVGSLARVAVNNETSFASTPVQPNRVRFRLLADGTNLHYQYSFNCFSWWDWYVAATPASLSHYGFCLGEDYGGAGNAWCRALVYKCQKKALTALTITGATNATPIVITTSAPHGLLSGDQVAIHSVGGNTAANTGTGNGGTAGAAWINVLSSTTFSLVGIAGNGAYTSGGTAVLISR